MPRAHRAPKLRGKRLATFLEHALATEGVADAARVADALSRRLSAVRLRDPAHLALVLRPPARPSETPAVVRDEGRVGVRPPVGPPPTSEPFNPRAFSLVATLANEGADALRARLDAIEDADQLRLMARVQHIPLMGEPSSLADLRAAIVRGAAVRLADRRAAAG